VKSAWMTGKQQIEVREEDYPTPEAEEVVIRIRACGICGTDLHYYHDFPSNTPIPLGHEVAGTVHETGTAVDDLQIGQTVAIQNHVPCASCTPCLMGKPQRCRNIQTYMDDRAALAEYLRVPRKMVVPYTGVSFEEAVLAEPLTVAFDLLSRAQIEPFQSVCVSGPGVIGLFCTKLATEAGARKVVVLGRGFQTKRGGIRKEAAQRLGAAVVVDTDEDAWFDTVKETAPDGFDKIIVTSPPHSIPATFELACFGADIIYNGISFREQEITFNANNFHFKKLALIASHAIPNWGFPLAFELLSQKMFNSARLVTHSFTFQDIEKAFAIAASRDEAVIKVVITL
jgi:threonine dehydrogenase-like Zn-dependent dehydrogenase